jgi:hypothetical protein
MKKLYCESPIGLVEAPTGIAKQIFSETDEELLSKLEVNGFIDPFRFAEAQRRGLKAKRIRLRRVQ